LLEVVDADGSVPDFAAQEAGQFEVGDEVKAASEIMAFLGPGVLVIAEGDAFQAVGAFGADRPATVAEGDTEEAGSDEETLGEFGGVT
jgi:hypothetical protein